MNSIIRGSNGPIVLESESALKITKLSAKLLESGKVKKTWSYTDITVQGNYLILPLSEQETLSLSRGVANLDIKILNDKNNIVFMDIINFKIVDRENETVLTGGV